MSHEGHKPPVPGKQSPEHRFSYVKYDDRAMTDQADLKERFIDLTRLCEEKLPPGRPLSQVLTALEEAYMWTGKGIRDSQIARTGTLEDQPRRSTE